MNSDKSYFKLSSSVLTIVCLLAAGLLLAACGNNSPGAATSNNSARPATTVEGQSTGKTNAGPTSPATPATTKAAAVTPAAAATSNEATSSEGVLAGSGDEPTVAYTDPTGLFSFQYPGSWGKTTQPGETIRFTGRDEFISLTITNTTQSPLDFAKADLASLSKASPNFKSAGGPQAYKVAGQNGAMIAYTWQAGPSPVTGKLVASSANRYYIPGPGGKLAIYTYSSPTNNYDPAGADDFANAFKWLK